MNIIVRLEEEKDYHKVEKITRSAFSYPGRIENGGIGCPFEHWMVHEAFFKIVREKNPELPVIFVTKPDYNSDVRENSKRREVVLKTYKNAVKAGDKNVYYIDGETLFGIEDRDSCTVDGCHPNDLGFMRMAQVICPVLKKALKIE